MSLLNSAPSEKLSTDRLRRVQNKQDLTQASELASAVDYRKEVGLHSDVSIFIKDRGSNPTFKLGRIQRMVKPGNRSGKIEYKRPINLENEKDANVEVSLTVYSSGSPEGIYIFCPGETAVFAAYNIIMGVKLNIQEDGTFIIDVDDRKELLEFLQEQETARGSSRRSNTSNNDESAQDMDDDGRRVEVIIPPSTSTTLSGCRRSGRTRRQVTFET